MSLQQNIYNLIIDLQINSKITEPVTEFNFLRLTVDENPNLNRNVHNQNVSKYIFHDYEFFTIALFFPLLNYGSCTWKLCLRKGSKKR